MRPISLVASFLLAFAATAGAQSQAPTLEERMSQSDFRNTGLDKLSAQELAQLNAWLQAHGGTTHRSGGFGGSSDFYPDSSQRTAVAAHIEGSFSGWSGNTIFKLDNGQEWQQSDSTRYDAGQFSSPAVTIKPMILGSWLMAVKGCGCSVRVRRIK